MSDLVLVRPGIYSAAEQRWSDFLPLGLGYLAAYCRKMGIEVSIVDGKLAHHLNPDDTIGEITKHRPRFVGVSAMTYDYPLATNLLMGLKYFDSSIATFLGGAHANALPEQSMRECEAIDYIIGGEAEFVLPDFILGYEKKETVGDSFPGLYGRNGASEIICSAPPSYSNDISEIVFPAWDLFPRLECYPLMTERGCPYNCVFCSHNMSKRIRARSPESVMGEIEWVQKSFSPWRIDIEDETFGINTKRTSKLLDAIIRFNENGKLKFKAQTRADRVKPEIIKKMKRAGFNLIELGIETGDPDVMQKSGKNLNLDRVENAVNIIKKEGISTWLNFIIGLPGDSEESVWRSIKLAAKLNPDRLSVAIIVPYPGSDIYDMAIKNEGGYRMLTSNWSRFDKYLNASVELDNLSYRKMQQLQVKFYLYNYMYNRRVLDLVRMAVKRRDFIFSYLKRLFWK